MPRFTIPRIVLIAAITGTLSGCDATQRAKGIVVDRATGEPLPGVKVRRTEVAKEDSPYGQDSTGADGRFEYSRTGFSNTFTLYFAKEGYRTESRSFDDRKIHGAHVTLDTVALTPSAASN